MAACGAKAAHYAPIWLVLALLAAAACAANGILVTIYAHDLYVVYESAWRTYSGQVPHLDYHTPIGPAYAWPWAVLKHVEPFSLLTLLHANFLVTAALLLIAALTLPKRLPPVLFFFLCLGIVAVAVSPRAHGFGPNVFSHLAPYNRWSQGAAMLVAAIALLAPRSEAHAPTPWATPGIDWAGSIALGLLLAFLCYLKVTYFLGCGGLVLAGLVFGQLRFGTAVVAALAFGVVALGVELTERNTLAYLADLAMAASATGEVHGGPRPLNGRVGAVLFVADTAAVVLLMLLAAPERRIAFVQARWRILAIAALGFAAAAVMNTQNHIQPEIPPMGTVLLVAVELIRRAGGKLPLRSGKGAAGAALLFIGAVAIPMVDVVAVVGHTLASRSACAVPALNGLPGERFLLPPRAFTGNDADTAATCAAATVAPEAIPLSTSLTVEAARLGEAARLLDGRLTGDASVLTLDFSNPFPAFTGTRPPKGALIWWDMGRDYAPNARPDPSVMLGSATFVLQSKYDLPGTSHGADLWRVYGRDVEARYDPVAEGRIWRLWERRADDGSLNGQARGPEASHRFISAVLRRGL